MMRCSTLDSTESIRMINCWVVIVIVSLTSSIFADAANVCSVEPTAAVVTSGERLTLNCTARRNITIHSWQVGVHIERKLVVYSPPSFGRNGTVKKNQTLGDGYSVTNVAENKISLHMSKITFFQAGLYVCQCGDQALSTATTIVIVLASEPQFNATSSIVKNGKPVILSCHISFNGSADISSNLIIKDISGTVVNRTTCYSNNSLTPCALNYTITADAYVDQSFTCCVELINNNSKIYSRLLNSSLNWQRVTSAEIVMSNPNKCFAGKCVISESIKCETDGNPGMTSYKWWLIHDNGSKLEIGNHNKTLVLTNIGRLTYQCQAYSTIPRVNHKVTSKNFTIDVTANDNSVSGLTSTTMLVVIGISVAIGIVIVFIAIFVTRICCSRRQTNRQTSRALSTQDSSVPPPQRQPTNRYDKAKLTNPGQQQDSSSTASNHPAASNNENKLTENELVLFDNDLYGAARGASPDPVAPSVPEENIYNEIGLHTLN